MGQGHRHLLHRAQDRYGEILAGERLP